MDLCSENLVTIATYPPKISPADPVFITTYLLVEGDLMVGQLGKGGPAHIPEAAKYI